MLLCCNIAWSTFYHEISFLRAKQRIPHCRYETQIAFIPKAHCRKCYEKKIYKMYYNMFENDADCNDCFASNTVNNKIKNRNKSDFMMHYILEIKLTNYGWEG